jgi:hypothetical protein
MQHFSDANRFVILSPIGTVLTMIVYGAMIQ